MDVRLTYQVAQGLQADALTRGSRITVEVQNGVVLLEGKVHDAAVKQKAADVARGTPGVRDICNVLYAGESPGAASDELLQLERLVASVTAERADSVRSASRHTRRWWLIAVSAVAAWALLSVAILHFGWIVAVIGCFCAAVVVEVANTVRERTRDRGGKT
jgi:hypothetical protein